MGLFDFLKPKWKSKNPEVRLAAVGVMGAKELGTLKDLAAADEDRRVRLAALERIDDRESLEELAGRALGPEVLPVVRAKIDRLLCEAALGGVESAGIEAALARIEDLTLVERLAAQAPTPALRVIAVERIVDQEALCRIVEKNCGKEPARVALVKIHAEPLLARIAKSGASKVTRRLAEEKLAARASERAEPDETEPRGREPEGLSDEAGRLAGEAAQGSDAARRGEVAGGSDGGNGLGEVSSAEANTAGAEALAAVEALVGTPDESADERFREAQARWVAAGAAEGSASLAERFERACEGYRSARQAIEEERRRLGEFAAELDRAEESLEPQNPERTRRILVELDRRVRSAGFRFQDPSGLLSRLEAAGARCEARLAALAEEETRARREALERRFELCAELEGLVEAADRVAAGRRVKELRKTWRELPPSPNKDGRALDDRFRAAADRFSVRQAGFLEAQEWLRWTNKTLKEELCTAVEALDAEEDLGTLADNVKEAQRRWKEIGPAPREEAEALWQRFKSACDRGFERCKPYLEELDRQRAEGIERREELCRQAETHVESTDWKESAESLKRLQAAWKEEAPIPRRREEALHARFRKACDRFFERRQAHFAEVDEGRRGVQAEKESLCARAEALAAEPDRGHTREFRELQAAWKRLGPAPREVDRALWERFRGSCDQFFAWLDEGRRENLRRKESLCEEVEALLAGASDDADSREVAATIAAFQKRWNEIGPAPKEEEDAIWERFHRPLDEFFAACRARGRDEIETGASQPL